MPSEMQNAVDASPLRRKTYLHVLLPISIDALYTYLPPDDSSPPLEPGTRVLVPVGNGEKIGVVWEVLERPPNTKIKLKKIKEILETEPAVPDILRNLIEWTARYYLHPLGSVLMEALPPGLISPGKKGVEKIITPKKGRNSKLSFVSWSSGFHEKLTEEQKKVIKPIMESISSDSFNTFLIHGVTGSGKTEVYLRAAGHCLKKGRPAIVLVPEIAMTTQTVGIFKERFGDLVAVQHSGLTPKQRLDQWHEIRTGQRQLIVGTRSAIFAPVSDIGLIVVDEEHDPSYKQTEKLRYNARDMAILRGKMSNGTVVLGSATPSLQSFFNAEKRKYHLLTMEKRVMERPLPEVAIIDRKEGKKKGSPDLPRWMSGALYKALAETLGKGQQSLIFLNRRGFATYIFCPDCGYVFRCPDCEISLAWHRFHKTREDLGKTGNQGFLVCHSCGMESPALPLCPSCQGNSVKASGFGTERIGSELKKLFPNARIARLDKDTVTKRKKREEILRTFRNGAMDMLVGTQMITKGHDFPNLTLVGIVWADLSLNFPDYLSSERTFQLLSQVSGRAGRAEIPGKVLIQTWLPDHYSIQFAKDHDFQGFYTKEMSLRKIHSYPPFTRFIRIIFSGSQLKNVEKAVEKISEAAKKLAIFPVEILGPSPAPYFKLKGKYRFQLLIKSPSYSKNRTLCEGIFQKKGLQAFTGVKIEVDVDPLSML